jgi:PhoH-like ATPase
MPARKKAIDRKIFVLDTSVILYDHNAITNFAEHDVAIPITVLEELDNFKKGNDTINFEAREFIRFLDKLSRLDAAKRSYQG